MLTILELSSFISGTHMKTLLKLITGLILVVVIAAIIAIQLISTEDVINEVSTKVEQATGRTLTVNGEHQLSVFPSLLIELKDVRLANIKAGSKPDLASIKELVVHIPWMSVFSGELEIEKFVIDDPDILLEKFSDTTTNWQFSPAVGGKNGKAATPQKEAAANNKGSTFPDSFDIALGQVEVNGGTITYIDHQTNQTKSINELKLAIKLPSLNSPLNISGSIQYMENTFKIDSSITTPRKVLNNHPFSMALAVTSDLVNLNYQGEVIDQGKQLKGNFSITGDSVKNLLAWQNMPLTAKEQAFNQFSLSTNLSLANNELAFDDLNLKLDELAIEGASTIALSTPLTIKAEVDLGTLDLNPYLPEVAEKPPEADKPNQPIIWDDTEIDLSSLKALNADVTIRSSQLKAREIKLGKNEINVSLNAGVANIQLREFQAYEGQGSGSITVDSRNRPYQINTNFSLSNINAGPLLSDAAGFDKLLGKGNLSWQLTTQGVSQRSFIEKLNGDLKFKFIDGAIKGANLAAIAKSASSILKGDLSSVSLDSDFSNAEKTDFAELVGVFAIDNGVANAKDISLKNPFIRVTGQGDINLPKTELGLQIQTKVVASTKGQAATDDKSGITIPIKITGPFHQVKIRPDVSSGAKDKIKDKVKDKVKNKLKDLFG